MARQTTDDMEWKPIRDCPDDLDRPGSRRTWRLRCQPYVPPGRTFVVDVRDFPGALPVPFETAGRRTIGNNTGWAETGTNRELHPTHFAPLAGE